MDIVKSAKDAGKTGKKLGQRGLHKGAKLVGNSVRSILGNSNRDCKEEGESKKSSFFHADDTDGTRWKIQEEKPLQQRRRSSLSDVPSSQSEAKIFWSERGSIPQTPKLSTESIRLSDLYSTSDLGDASGSSDDDSYINPAKSSSDRTDRSADTSGSGDDDSFINSNRTNRSADTLGSSDDDSIANPAKSSSHRTNRTTDTKSNRTNRTTDTKSNRTNRTTDTKKSTTRKAKRSKGKKKKKKITHKRVDFTGQIVTTDDQDDNRSKKSKNKKTKKSKKGKKEKKKPKKTLPELSDEDADIISISISYDDEGETMVGGSMRYDDEVEVETDLVNSSSFSSDRQKSTGTGVTGVSTQASISEAMTRIEREERKRWDGKMSSMKKEMRDLQDKNEKLQKRLEEETRRSRKLRADLTRIEMKLSKSVLPKMDDVEFLQDEIDQLQRELNMERDSYERIYKESRSEIAELQNTVDTLQEEAFMSNNNSTHANGGKSVDRLHGELLYANGRVERLEHSRRKQDDEIRRLKEELAIYKEDKGIKELEENLELSREEEKRLRNELDNVENDWEEKLRSKEETIEYFLKEISTLKLQQASSGGGGTLNHDRSGGFGVRKLSESEIQDVLRISTHETPRAPQSIRRISLAGWLRR